MAVSMCSNFADELISPIEEMLISRSILLQFNIWAGEKDRVIEARVLNRDRKHDPFITVSICFGTILAKYKNGKIVKDEDADFAVGATFLILLESKADTMKLQDHTRQYYNEAVKFLQVKKLTIADVHCDITKKGNPRQIA